MYTRTEAADEHIRSRDIVFFHQRQCAVDTPPGGQAKANATSIFLYHLNKTLQRWQVANQVLVQVGKNGTIAITQRT